MDFVIQLFSVGLWLLLFAGSVYTFALLAGLLVKKSKLPSTNEPDILVQQLTVAMSTGDSTTTQKLEKWHKGLSDQYTWLWQVINPTTLAQNTLADDSIRVDMLIGICVKRTLSTCNYVTRSAPFVGLMLTFVGVSQSLAAFARSPGDRKSMFEGIYTALTSTLAGMLLAIVCLAVTRLLLEPRINDKRIQMLQLVRELRAVVAKSAAVPRTRRQRPHTNRRYSKPDQNGEKQYAVH